MSDRVRIVVYLVVDDAEKITEIYHQISKELAGTKGLLGNELMRSVMDPTRFAVMSEWESLEAFQVWDQGSSHKGTTAPLRPYHDTSNGPGFGIYHVTASY